MAHRKGIRDMCEDKYSDQELIEAVIDDANRNDTTSRIEKGELTLPSEQDAALWHRRSTNREQFEGEQAHQRKRVDELEQKLAAFMSKLTPDRPPSKETEKEYRKIIKEGQS